MLLTAAHTRSMDASSRRRNVAVAVCIDAAQLERSKVRRTRALWLTTTIDSLPDRERKNAGERERRQRDAPIGALAGGYYRDTVDGGAASP